jgi:monothiol glutaredoxin
MNERNIDTVKTEIEAAIAKDPVVLFVKGTPSMPMCGFSKGVMDVFQSLGVTYKTYDVLEDSLIREGVKQFTQWPTIPQIFIKGEFIGGYDIVKEMYQKGELQKMLAEVTEARN